MSDGIRLYKHVGFKGPSVNWAGPNSTKGVPRIKGFTHQALQYDGLHKQISSFKFEEVHPDRRVSTILFEKDGFEGDFIAFLGKKPGRSISDLNSHNFNDKTASILMINHTPGEHIGIPIGVVARDSTTQIIDTELKKAIHSRGVGASRRGDIVFTWEMRPHFAQHKMLLQIDIPLTVEISIWPDYDASVSFFIYPYLNNQSHLRARVLYVKGWVEGGMLSGSIASQLKSAVTSKSVTGRIEQEVNALLENLDYCSWEDFYLMPGEAPIYSRNDYSGNTRDDVTLVLVPQ